MADTPKSQVTESGEYENLMELNEQNKQAEQENPDAFQSLFDVEETVVNPDHWTEHWKGMPEYKQENNGPWKTIRMHFRNEEDYNEFSKLTKNNLTEKTKSAWYPKLEITKNALLRWIEDDDGDEDVVVNDEDENNEGWSPEERMDIIGQNGNDGLHYSDE
jgi:hypothetical protein